jgi:hypothetical protein
MALETAQECDFPGEQLVSPQQTGWKPCH